MGKRLGFKNSIGNQSINVVQQESLAFKDAPTTIMVDLTKIKENPDNNLIYGAGDENDIASLKTSITRNGFLGSVILFDLGDGSYEICSGHRRTRAMRELGKPMIPAVVVPLPDDTQKAEMLLACNLNDRQTTPIQKAREIEYYQNTHKDAIKNNEGRTREIIAEFFGISASKVYRYSNLLSLTDKLQSLAENEDFPWHALGKAKELDEAGQNALYDKIVAVGPENVTGKNIHEIIDGILHPGGSVDDTKVVHGEHISHAFVHESTEENADPGISRNDDGGAAKPQDHSDIGKNMEARQESQDILKERRINDYESDTADAKDPAAGRNEKYSKTEIGRLKIKLSELAEIMDFSNNDILVYKDATIQWYEKLSDLVQEMGRYVRI